MLPKYYSFSVLCILLLIIPLHSLRCYECKTCLTGIGQEKECSKNENACMKGTFGSIISKKCVHDVACVADKFEKTLTTGWRNFKNLFKNQKEGGNKTGSTGNKFFNCCYSDLCNSGNRLRNHFGTLVASCLLTGFIYFGN